MARLADARSSRRPTASSSARCSAGSTPRRRCPSLVETVERWRPDLDAPRVRRARLDSPRPSRPACRTSTSASACTRSPPRFAEAVVDPLDELGVGWPASVRVGPGGRPGLTRPSSAWCPRSSTTRQARCRREAAAFLRFHEPRQACGRPTACPDWGDPDHPLVYVTLGSVTGSLPPSRRRPSVQALGRARRGRGARPDDGRAEARPRRPRTAACRTLTWTQWWPQDAVLAEAAAMLGHGGFGHDHGRPGRRCAPGGRAALQLRPGRQRRACGSCGCRHSPSSGGRASVDASPAADDPPAARRSRRTPRRPRRIAAAIADLPSVARSTARRRTRDGRPDGDAEGHARGLRA